MAHWQMSDDTVKCFSIFSFNVSMHAFVFLYVLHAASTQQPINKCTGEGQMNSDHSKLGKYLTLAFNRSAHDKWPIKPSHTHTHTLQHYERPANRKHFANRQFYMYAMHATGLAACQWKLGYD